MKSLKLIITIAAFAASALVAQAQSYNLGYMFTPAGTMNIAATSTNTTLSATNGTTIAFTRTPTYAALQPTFKLTGAGTTAVVFKFDTSVDGQSWTDAAISISVTPAGTTLVSTTANQTVGSIGYLRLSQIQNPNATAITNLYVAYSGKTP